MSSLQPMQLEIVLFFDDAGNDDWFGLRTDPLNHYTSEQMRLVKEKGKEIRKILGI